jgi:hypothetical protein
MRETFAGLMPLILPDSRTPFPDRSASRAFSRRLADKGGCPKRTPAAFARICPARIASARYRHRTPTRRSETTSRPAGFAPTFGSAIPPINVAGFPCRTTATTHQVLMAATAFFSLLTDAGDIPASRAACLTPLPAANSRLAFSIFALAIGGRPNLMDKLRAAA